MERKRRADRFGQGKKQMSCRLRLIAQLGLLLLAHRLGGELPSADFLDEGTTRPGDLRIEFEAERSMSGGPLSLSQRRVAGLEQRWIMEAAACLEAGAARTP